MHSYAALNVPWPPWDLEIWSRRARRRRYHFTQKCESREMSILASNLGRGRRMPSDGPPRKMPRGTCAGVGVGRRCRSRIGIIRLACQSICGGIMRGSLAAMAWRRQRPSQALPLSGEGHDERVVQGRREMARDRAAHYSYDATNGAGASCGADALRAPSWSRTRPVHDDAASV